MFTNISEKGNLIVPKTRISAVPEDLAEKYAPNYLLKMFGENLIVEEFYGDEWKPTPWISNDLDGEDFMNIMGEYIYHSRLCAAEMLNEEMKDFLDIEPTTAQLQT